MKFTENCYEKVIELIKEADKIIVGLGSEWRMPGAEAILTAENQWQAAQRFLEQAGKNGEEGEAVQEGYRALSKLVAEKDCFILTTNTDAAVYRQVFPEERIVAPCGDIRRMQCEEKEHGVWNWNRKEESICCPVCKRPGRLNIFQNKPYVETGYLKQWESYQLWLQNAMNRKIVILELGEGFLTPTVMRWPFEKLAYFQEKATLYCVHESLSMLSEEISSKAYSVEMNSIQFIEELEKRWGR